MLDQQALVQRNVDTTDLILLVESGGQIIGMTRDELRAYFGRIVARLQTLGVTDAYLNRLPFLERTIFEALIKSNGLPEVAINKIKESSIVLRAVERGKLPLIEEDLAQVRARAADIQRQREALRAWIARGDGSGFESTPDMAVCRNSDIPADFNVSEATVGYGGTSGHKAKGPISAYGPTGSIFARAMYLPGIIATLKPGRIACAMTGNPLSGPLMKTPTRRFCKPTATARPACAFMRRHPERGKFAIGRPLQGPPNCPK